MSRSRKKSPVCKNLVCKSERADKKRCHKMFRRNEHLKMQTHNFGLLPYKYLQFLDRWVMRGDGKDRSFFLRPADDPDRRYIMRK